MSALQGARRHGNCTSLTYTPSLVLVCALVHLIDPLGKLFKVRDDEHFPESLRQQHDVVAPTSARKKRGGTKNPLI